VVGVKLDCYSKLIDIDQVREFSRYDEQPSTAVCKAMRTLCLLLKALTQMNRAFKQIKDDEVFL
jgi:hypothetical protein